jgi:hypothetical protein
MAIHKNLWGLNLLVKRPRNHTLSLRPLEQKKTRKERREKRRVGWWRLKKRLRRTLRWEE